MTFLPANHLRLEFPAARFGSNLVEGYCGSALRYEPKHQTGRSWQGFNALRLEVRII